MTVKEFFKSTAFKCIVVLLCVLLISGIFLTVMNGLLAVSDEEKFNRKVGNLYTDGSSITTEVKVETETKVGDSTIEKVWFIPEKNDYLVQVYAQGRDGKITMWVIISTANNNVSGVGTVLVYDKVDSEYAYKISGWNTNISNFSEDYVNGIKYAYGDKTSDMYINTGASTSFTAICACVNGAITYIQAYASGGTIEASPFESFLYNDYINQDETTLSVEDGKVTYNIKTKGYDGEAEPFILEIVVGSDKKIESFKIKTNGSTDNGEGTDYKDIMPDVESIFEGKDLSYFTNLYGEDMAYKGLSSNKDDNELKTGASNANVASKSTYLCAYAAAFATANYDEALLKGGSTNE